MFSAIAPFLVKWYHFSATQVFVLAAMEPLFAAAVSIPLGILTDKFGGRTVFTLLLLSLAIPRFLGKYPKKGDGEAQKQKRKNRPATELVRQDPEREYDGGGKKGLHRSQDEHLGGAEMVPLNQEGCDRGKPSPNRKTERKRQERYKQYLGISRQLRG